MKFLRKILSTTLAATMLFQLPVSQQSGGNPARISPITEIRAEDIPAQSQKRAAGFYEYSKTDDHGHILGTYVLFTEVFVDGHWIPLVEGMTFDQSKVKTRVRLTWEPNNEMDEVSFNLGSIRELQGLIEFDKWYDSNDANSETGFTSKGTPAFQFRFIKKENGENEEIELQLKVESVEGGNRHVELEFYGWFDLMSGGYGDGDQKEIVIDEIEIPFQSGFSREGVSIHKDRSSIQHIQPGEDGYYYIEYTVTQEILEDHVKGLVLTDDLFDGEKKENWGTIVGEVSVSIVPPKNDLEYAVEKGGSHTISIEFDRDFEFNQKDQITYTYTIRVDQHYMRQLVTGESNLSNIAQAEYGSGGQVKTESKLSSYTPPSIKKTGTEKDGEIIWRIELDLSGILSFLNDFYKENPEVNFQRNNSFLNSEDGKRIVSNHLKWLGFGDTIVDELLGDNQSFKDAESLGDITGSRLEMLFEKMNYDETKGKYYVEIKTTPNDKGEMFWENKVSFGEGKYEDTGTAFNEQYSIKKEAGTLNPNNGKAVEEKAVDEEHQTISWVIRVPIPDDLSELGGIDITERPTNSSKDGKYPGSGKDNTWDPYFLHFQEILEETIQVDGKNLSELEGKVEIRNRETAEGNRGISALTIRILESYLEEIKEKNPNTKEVVITLQTKVQYSDINDEENDDAFKGYYHYENVVTASWFGSENFKKPKEQTDYAEVENSKEDFAYQKVAPSESYLEKKSPWYQTWEIQILKPVVLPFKETNWTSENGTVHFRFDDTLPTGTSFVEGSLKLVLFDPASKGNPYKEAQESAVLQGYLNELTGKLNLVAASNQEGQLTIDFDLKKIDLKTLSDKYGSITRDFVLGIRYETKIKDGTALKNLWDKLSNNERSSDHFTLPFTNVARATIDGHRKNRSKAVTTRNFENSIYKTNTWSSENADSNKFKYSAEPVSTYQRTRETKRDNDGNVIEEAQILNNVFFQIEINPDMVPLFQTGRLTIKDILDDDTQLEILNESIRVWDVGNLPEKELIKADAADSLTPDQYYSSKSGTRLTLDVPDSKHLIITYWAEVPVDLEYPYQLLEATNTVQIIGLEDIFNSTTKPDADEYFRYSTSSGYKSVSLTVHKTDSQGKDLSGAQFALTQLRFVREYDDSGEKTENYHFEERKTYFPEYPDDYHFLFEGLSNGAMYMLEEIKAPTGYKKIEPVLFVTEDFDKLGWLTGNYEKLQDINELLNKAETVILIRENSVIKSGYEFPSVGFEDLVIALGSEKGTYNQSSDEVVFQYNFEEKNELAEDNKYKVDVEFNFEKEIYLNGQEVQDTSGFDNLYTFTISKAKADGGIAIIKDENSVAKNVDGKVEFSSITLLPPKDYNPTVDWRGRYWFKISEDGTDKELYVYYYVDLYRNTPPEKGLDVFGPLFFDKEQYELYKNDVITRHEIENVNNPDKYIQTKRAIRNDVTIEDQDLTLQKQVEGNADVNREYTFTITVIEPESGEVAGFVDGIYGDVVFEKGTANNVSLRKGDEKEIKGLPKGYRYEIEEVFNTEDQKLFDVTFEVNPEDLVLDSRQEYKITLQESENSDQRAITVIATNHVKEMEEEIELPVTGGNGQALLVGAGGLLVLGGVSLTFISPRRKRRQGK